MLTHKILLAVLLSLHPWHLDNESPDVREARMSVVATSIGDASDALTCSGAYAKTACKPAWTGTRDQLAMWLLIQGYFESSYALDVHDGSCNKVRNNPKYPRCDFGRSASVWQLQLGYHFPIDRWTRSIGLSQESTNYAARQAGLALARSYNACYSSRGYAGMVSMYVTGSSCYWKPKHNRGADVRVSAFHARMAQARALAQKSP